MERWLSIVGSLASVISALWAWHEAIKASKAASKAESLRDEIVHRRKIVEVSQVHIETQRILRVIAKIGPSSTTTQLRGINSANIAADVDEFLRFLNEQSSNFSEPLKNRARELCDTVSADIEKLAEAKTPEDKKDAGKAIYFKINAFMPIVKDLADEKRESIHLT